MKVTHNHRNVKLGNRGLSLAVGQANDDDTHKIYVEHLSTPFDTLKDDTIK